jgi:hypothetical protein
MAIQSHLESKPGGEEAHLPAEEPHGVDVGIDVGVDPGDARAQSKTLSSDGCGRGQQRNQREHRDGGLAAWVGVIESHRLNSGPDMLTAIRRRLEGSLTRIGTGCPELQLANALPTISTYGCT